MSTNYGISVKVDAWDRLGDEFASTLSRLVSAAGETMDDDIRRLLREHGVAESEIEQLVEEYGRSKVYVSFGR